jgi:hypothetical protein
LGFAFGQVRTGGGAGDRKSADHQTAPLAMKKAAGQNPQPVSNRRPRRINRRPRRTSTLGELHCSFNTTNLLQFLYYQSTATALLQSIDALLFVFHYSTSITNQLQPLNLQSIATYFFSIHCKCPFISLMQLCSCQSTAASLLPIHCCYFITKELLLPCYQSTTSFAFDTLLQQFKY